MSVKAPSGAEADDLRLSVTLHHHQLARAKSAIWPPRNWIGLSPDPNSAGMISQTDA
jgi:hypothetical protein